MLASGPSHGYELKVTFEEAIGPQWGELNIGHLYQVLERLVRDGLVTRRAVPQRDRPDRIDYRLTAKGQRELDAWLARPFIRQSGYRDELFLKIFAGAGLGAGRLKDVTRVQRHAYLSELATLGGLRAHHGNDPLVALLIEAAILHTEANLRVLDGVDEHADQLASVPAVMQAHQEKLRQAR
jgi:DNA-binding PadR family transcriptional regulator